MPPTSQSTDHVQIAASNRTLNAFLGGRRPSWIQNTAKTTAHKQSRPIARRSLSGPRQDQSRTCTAPATQDQDGVTGATKGGQIASQKPDQQLATTATSDTSLLPSPALTNEPSPALSTRHASPSEHTSNGASQAENIIDHEPRAPEALPSTNQASPITTDPPHAIDVGMIQIDDGPEPLPNQVISEPVSSQASPSMVQQADPVPALTAPSDSQASGPGSSNNSGPSSTTVKSSSIRKRGRVSTASVDRRAPQRPRLDMPYGHGGYTTSTDAVAGLDGQWQAQLEERIIALGGWSQLGPGIEAPRFKYLRDALVAGDSFYVLLHQLLCLGSLSPSRACRALPALSPDRVEKGFAHLQQILRSNSLLAHSSLLWFSNFPQPLAENGYTADPSMTLRIGSFLDAFVQDWELMLNEARRRMFPLMADELGPRLKCESQILQGTLFTVTRRVVGIMDAVAGPLNNLFCQDQKDEMRMREERRTADEVSRFRHERASEYFSLTEQAKRILVEQDPSRSSSVTAQTTPPVPPQRAQTFPTATAQPPPSQPRGPSVPASSSPGQTSRMLPSQLIAPNVRMPIPTLPRNSSMQASSGDQSPSSQGAPPHLLVQAQQHAAGRFSPGIPPQLHANLRQPASQPVSPQSLLSPVHMNMASVPSASNLQASQPVSHPSPHYQQQLQQQLHHTQQFQQTQPHYRQVQQLQHIQHIYQAQNTPQPQQIPQTQHTRHIHYTNEPQHLVSSPAQSAQSQPIMLHLPHSAPHNAPWLTAQEQIALPLSPHTLPSNGIVESARTRYQSPQTGMRGIQRIPEHEYPSTPYDWVSHASAAHLSNLRSPERRAGRNVPALVRYYQYISGFAFEPVRFPPQTGPRSLEFTVSSDDLAKIPPASESECGLPVRHYSNGSLRYRLRLCMRPETDTLVSASDWVVCPTHWPQDIFPALNSRSLMVRRKQHFHHDLPIDLSDSLIKGQNVVRISFPERPMNFKKGVSYFVAIEIVSIVSHDSLTTMVLKAPRISVGETKAEIQRRLRPSESDDVVVEDNTFCINVADPFSFSMFQVPVRGATCKHLDCFDLETWLQTRQGKTGGGSEEPSMVDNWKCPICFLDARPSSLRVDEFFVEVRKGLLAQNLSQTKKILVAADGSWNPVPELDDSEDESPTQPHHALDERLDRRNGPAPLDIIEIDDD